MPLYETVNLLVGEGYVIQSVDREAALDEVAAG